MAQPPGNSSAAEMLGEFALGLRLADIDAVTVRRVKLHLLDQLAAQVSCRNLETPRIAREYAVQYGRAGTSAVLGTPLRLDAESAGFANGTAGSSFEIDDYGYGAYAHPGCVVVPAALAVAEETGASGAATLLALTAGFETVIRLAVATTPSLLVGRGFHQTGAHGVFAAALTTCMLENADLATAVNALAIAGSHAGGTTEYTQTGGEVKRAHSGIGVAGGIRSARLARLGLTGPPTIFEGKRGFLQAFCDDFEVAPLHERLGSRWYFTEHGAIKPYASCGLVHHHFAAYDKLVAGERFSPGDIESVVLGCEPLTLVHNGAAGPHPTDIVGAQFSAEYSMAMRVVTGRNDVGAYLDAERANFADPSVGAMADRVRLEADPECDKETPCGRVTLTLRDGRVLSALGYALGSPRNPLSDEGVLEKYRDLVGRDYGDEVARRSVEMVMDLENLPDLSGLTELFARD
ncbi:MmgE/PrpD family protein [Amycolatopsis jejuensis]|uniref:MmgE/PrpD family protein n=1 Tax=Amycolatopsis jejuensis TaxID=330084 RepID=UPI0009FEB738|nr:MmgE/PrpD family protein [Amycolatopsis jejuensis]